MTQSTLLDVAPGDLAANPLNPRRDLGDLTELADSIAERGVIEPIVAFQPDPAAALTILAGHRRAAAAVKAGVDTVPVLVVAMPDPSEQLALMLVENGQRTDLTPTEEAQAFGSLIESGWKQADIVRRTGRSPGHVSKRLSLLRLPEAALDLVDAGPEEGIALDVAVDLARLRDEKTVAKLVKEGVSEYKLTEALDRQDRADAAAQVRAELEAAGAALVEVAQLQNGSAALLCQDIGGWYSTSGVPKVHVLPMTAEAHADQPCHASAVFERRAAGKQVLAVCNEPGSHKGKTTVKMDVVGDQLNVENVKRTANPDGPERKPKVVDRTAERASFERLKQRQAERLEFLASQCKHVGRPACGLLVQHGMNASIDTSIRPQPAIAEAILGEDVVTRMQSGPKGGAQAAMALAAASFEGVLFGPRALDFDELREWEQAHPEEWSAFANVERFLLALYFDWLTSQGFKLGDVETEALAAAYEELVEEDEAIKEPAGGDE